MPSARVGPERNAERKKMNVHPAAEPEPTHKPNSGLIWLASYPKSGNTWARIFLSNLAAIMAGETEKLELNAIARFSHSADSSATSRKSWVSSRRHSTATKSPRRAKRCSRKLPIPMKA